jgi:hypothetical protein
MRNNVGMERAIRVGKASNRLNRPSSSPFKEIAVQEETKSDPKQAAQEPTVPNAVHATVQGHEAIRLLWAVSQQGCPVSFNFYKAGLTHVELVAFIDYNETPHIIRLFDDGTWNIQSVVEIR